MKENQSTHINRGKSNNTVPLLSNKLCYLSVLYLLCYLALRSVKLTLAVKSVDRMHTIQANTTNCLIVMVVTCQIESKQLVFHCLFVKCIAAQNFNFSQNDLKKNWRKKLSHQQAAKYMFISMTWNVMNYVFRSQLVNCSSLEVSHETSVYPCISYIVIIITWSNIWKP